MSIKSDRWITKMSKEHGMIEPFESSQVRSSVISYGVSSYGYDMRVSNDYKVFTNINSTVIDPKNFHESNFIEFEGQEVIIPPNSFALARSVEYFRIPRNVLAICLGKSTYARCGIICNVTPFEPEWEGHVTIEISNTTPLPAKIYSNEGICQVLFFRFCFSNQMSLVPFRIRTKKENIRGKRVSRCLDYKHWKPLTFIFTPPIPG